METLSSQIRNALESVKREFPVDSLYVFGSYARRDQRSDSDLDLLVVFSTVEKDPPLLPRPIPHQFRRIPAYGPYGVAPSGLTTV